MAAKPKDEKVQCDLAKLEAQTDHARVIGPIGPPESKPFTVPQHLKQAHIIRDKPWSPEMVLIPEGKFQMGSPDTEEGRLPFEGPQHEVKIRRPFFLGRYPVTFSEYDYFCEQTGRKKPKDSAWGRGDRPVIHVNHQDALDYCVWLSEVTGRQFHLPSEAQWEYACRAGSETPYSFGKYLTGKQANFGSHQGQTSEVGSFPSNDWGVYEMHGNIWEWCKDHWHANYQESPADENVRPLSDDRNHVLRGGSWAEATWVARSASRDFNTPKYSSGTIGFRCALFSTDSSKEQDESRFGPYSGGDMTQFYSCFISYSSNDQEFADRLYADLQNAGVRCWFAPHDLTIGAKTWDGIDDAIRTRDKVLLILSESAIASDWVGDEVTTAFAEERCRDELVLFPIRLDGAVMDTDEPWAGKLRDNRNICDFTRWKDHDAYKATLDRVLRDLKAAP